MGGFSGFDALSFLRGGDQTPVCGTWFFVGGQLLPRNRQGKMRSVVTCRDSSDGGVVVYTRSASRKGGFDHPAHPKHECGVTVSHDTTRAKFSVHNCHVNDDGWVDIDDPLTLNLSALDGCKMCFEDDASPLLVKFDEVRA